MTGRIPYDPTRTALPCFVRGCPTPPDRGAIHRSMGRVICCPSHDPSRHGYAVPFVQTQAPGLAALLDRPDIGPQPPVRPIDQAPEPMPPAPPARVLTFDF